MEQKNLEKATELFSALLVGEPVESGNGKNAALYNAYHESGEVSDALELMLKKLNLRVYEYNYALYLCVGEHNHAFGYNNEELKRAMGLRLNKELYLCYYLIYQVAAAFYQDSATYNYTEYIKLEDLLLATERSLAGAVSGLHAFAAETPEEQSFTALAITWDELPVVSNEDTQGVRAGRGSRSGFVKLVLNFLVAQGLLTETRERYYPTGRMHALIRRYFEEEKSRLYELQTKIGKGGENDAAH